ncbi:hypothetical protein POM88_003064 [Heracleum sosnowskyi]|uniref:Uncharacterized protein n=1 Tax=Heracleum sosnowskyi TaxID=360622 RepID=A0AAD8N6I8_9APIA|nr:hypothetical protein POM88_003060 [Heracleum sosnowskyi]KAK1403457.1 hypothetical protein POM88_003062 [Heracleum sosnowskyi]KAK1403459.1 hypothetical protein POM88_003064 [Heracleum sosnowskyi]
MGSLGLIIVLTLVALADTNIAIEARNVKLEEIKVVQQDPSPYSHMLPKGPVPPSGPSPGNPPATFSSSGLLHVSAGTWYHTMPKGDHHPPSGPSHGSTPDPPPGPPTTRF